MLRPVTGIWFEIKKIGAFAPIFLFEDDGFD